jgi:hypothetical protein
MQHLSIIIWFYTFWNIGILFLSLQSVWRNLIIFCSLVRSAFELVASRQLSFSMTNRWMNFIIMIRDMCWGTFMWVYITQVIYINYRLFLVSIDYSYTMDMFLLFFYICCFCFFRTTKTFITLSVCFSGI